MKQKVLLYLLLFGFINAAIAQPGRPDSAFGIKGRVTANLAPKTSYSSTATQVLTDASGNVYTVFFVNKISHIIKKLPNGSTDLTYGFSGYSSPVGILNPIAAIQPDGKIIIAGTTPKIPEQFEEDLHSDFILARFKTDGLPDESFGRHGIVTTDFNGLDDAATSISLQQDGKIILGGIATSFVNDGGNSNVYNMVISKYNTDGTPDKTFNSTGFVWAPDNYLTLTDFSTLIKVQADSKIIATRSTDEYGLVMIRFNSNGSIDNSFNLNTNLQTPDSTFIAKAVVIQTDGKIIIGGYWNWALSTDFSLYRFTNIGLSDISFGKQGHVITDFRGYPDFLNGLALQTDNKIVAVGSASNGSNNAFAVARYNANGSPDNTFDGDGKRMAFIGSYNVYPLSLSLLANNKIIAAGYNEPPAGNNIVLAKYNIDGSFDDSFHVNGTITENFKQGSTVYTSTVEQPDGKVIAAGYLFNGNDYDFLISRFNTNGSFDKSFSGDGNKTISFSNSNDYAFAVALQKDGKVIVSGQAINNNNNADFALARLNVDGTVDNSFDGDGKQTTDISTNDNGSHMLIQADGKILVGANNILLRYSATGALDPSFNGTGRLNSIIPVNDFALQSTGKIIIGGYHGFNFALARYNTNGTIDNSFSQDGLVETNLYPNVEYDGYNQYFGVGKSVAIQKDDKIILAGEAGRYERYGKAINIGVARYDKDGVPDNSFSDDGIQFVDYSVYETNYAPYSQQPQIVLQNNNAIIIKSNLYKNQPQSNSGNVMALWLGFCTTRLTAQGALDNSFGKAGYLSLNKNNILGINVINNKLYMSGHSIDAGKSGIIERYILDGDNTPPVVVITSPSNNAAFASPANITITASANDADGSIHSVKFYKGDTYIKADFTAPYSYTFSNLPSGVYTFKVKATDNIGLETYSAPITVKVNTPPVVSITSPANNAVYTAPATIAINATASDPDGSVHSVKVYKNDNYIKADFAAPYSFTLSNLQAGTYTIKVKATDNLGAETYSLVKTITVKSQALNSSINNDVMIQVDDKTSEGLQLNPNPAKNVLHVLTKDFIKDDIFSLSILSLNGTMIKQMNVNAKMQTIAVDISTLQSGTYILQLKSGIKILSKQFIKL